MILHFFIRSSIFAHFIKFSDDEFMHDINLIKAPNLDLIVDVLKNPADNLYLLYTRHNPTKAQKLVMNDPKSIKKSHFNHKLTTVVIAHGWLNDQHSYINTVLRDAFLEKRNVNVIVLDWSRLSKCICYVTTIFGVPHIGKGLAQFLEFLKHTTGAHYSNMHLVGFSLGAHLVGIAGRTLNGKIARITGLDPAGPLWRFHSLRLDKSNAVYVEAIHTSTRFFGGFGLRKRLAHADFYPNGDWQNGCLTEICNHAFSWKVFGASITHNHLIAHKCYDLAEMEANNCHHHGTLHMGNDDIKKTGRGIYRLDTKAEYPY